MHKLGELKEMLCEELESYSDKGKLDVGGLEIVDKLAHAIKNIDKIIESDGMDGNSRMYPYYYGGSYTRSRGMRRDGMGRYSRAENDMDGLVDELRGMMGELPQDKQTEVRKFIERIERM